VKKVNKKELGLGIRALLGNMDEEFQKDAPAVIRELNTGILEIPIREIEVNPFQPRTEFESESLQELSKSIASFGLIQPVTVRRLNENAYQLISGERRFRASQMAGLEAIPAYIRVANDQEMLEMALVENIQRRDLNAIEVAISYQRLMDECKYTHEVLSDKIGKDRSTVTNYTRLLKLPPEVQQAIKLQEISMGHARALAGIQDIALQLALLHKTRDEELSVRALEQMIRKHNLSKNKTPNRSSKADDPYKHVIRSLADYLDTEVAVKTSPQGDGGTISIRFEDIQDFNRILELIHA
jgi:ParB family transcriptional regulator, chromosome partitioning protein